MKKIFSLLMVVAIVLTMSVATMAADPVSGMKFLVTETDSDITVSVIIGNYVSLSGYTASLATTAVTYVEDSYVNKLSFDKVTPTLNKAGIIQFALAASDSSLYTTNDGDVEAFTFKVAKVDPSKELSVADFAHAEKTLNYSKMACASTGSICGIEAPGNNFNNKKQPSYFTVEYVDDRTKDDPDPEPTVEWDGFTTAETADWNTNFAYKAEDGGEDITAGYTGKKVVAFGKNATTGTLAAETYGIKIGKNAYAGMLPVDAGKVFAIILIDSNNDTKVGDTSYFYSIWNGTEDNIVKSGLQATIAQ